MKDDKNAASEVSRECDPAPEGDRFHVTWESPVFDLSGYASSARSALFGLEDLGVRLRLIPFRDRNRSEP